MQRNDPASASSPDRATPNIDQQVADVREGAEIMLHSECGQFAEQVLALCDTVTAPRADAELLARIAESAVKWDEGGVAIVMSPTLWQEIRLAAARSTGERTP